MRIARLLSLVLSVCLSLAAAAKPSKTITVDCSKNQSINAALDDKSDSLIVEVRGICTEDVQIRRDNVVLRGNDPTLDGIDGAATVNAVGYGALLVRDSRQVKIENLLVTGSVRNGIAANNSTGLEVINCRLVGNANYGFAGTSGTTSISDTTIDGTNGFGGFEGGLITCTNCTITVTSLGIISAGGSRVAASGSDIDAFYSVVSTQAGSQVTILNSTVSGSLDVEDKSLVKLANVTQTSNPDLNYVLVGSTLSVTGTSSLTGDTTIEKFSNFSMAGPSTHTGTAECASGSDMYCSNPANAGTVINCNSCIGSMLSAPLDALRSSAKNRPPQPRKDTTLLLEP
jgi:hypothetical protein